MNKIFFLYNIQKLKNNNFTKQDILYYKLFIITNNKNSNSFIRNNVLGFLNTLNLHKNINNKITKRNFNIINKKEIQYNSIKIFCNKDINITYQIEKFLQKRFLFFKEKILFKNFSDISYIKILNNY